MDTVGYSCVAIKLKSAKYIVPIEAIASVAPNYMREASVDDTTMALQVFNHMGGG